MTRHRPTGGQPAREDTAELARSEVTSTFATRFCLNVKRARCRLERKVLEPLRDHLNERSGVKVLQRDLGRNTTLVMESPPGVRA